MAAQSEEISGHEMVVELLNDASMAMDPNEKLDCLRKVQETIIHRVKMLFFPDFLCTYIDFLNIRNRLKYPNTDFSAN